MQRARLETTNKELPVCRCLLLWTVDLDGMVLKEMQLLQDVAPGNSKTSTPARTFGPGICHP